MTVPVLDIPRLLFDAKAEDARTEQAVIAYEKTVQTAYGDAENALVNLAAGKQAVATLVDGEARAHRAYDAAQTRYRLGFDDLTTALSAETAWRATRIGADHRAGPGPAARGRRSTRRSAAAGPTPPRPGRSAEPRPHDLQEPHALSASSAARPGRSPWRSGLAGCQKKAPRASAGAAGAHGDAWSTVEPREIAGGV